jgi:GDSL-like Lipase/Acylhydrolase family
MAGPVARRRVGAWRLVSLVVACAAVASAWTTLPVGPASAQTPPDSYVALGDSFTAGPLIPVQSLDPLGCLRSDRNYPHLVAPATGLPAFRDVSCSGADTDDMFNAQGVTPGPNPPQLDALDAGTRLVTLGVGGNDIGFSEIIESCVTLLPWETPCQDRYRAGGSDELSARIAATAPKVAAVLDAVRSRAPGARTLVVGYPAILPDTGSGCWPQMPIGWNDVPYIRAKQKELNAMLAAQASGHGATYVDVYAPSIGHDACRSLTTRWVRGARGGGRWWW